MRYLIVALLLLTANLAFSQARLTIRNNSMRSMTIKVMRLVEGKSSLHERVTIEAYGSETVYFSNTGSYFTKSKASLNGRDPIYQKGKSFKVYNGSDGYSVMTLTFSIKESEVPQVTGGQRISKQEFDAN